MAYDENGNYIYDETGTDQGQPTPYFPPIDYGGDQTGFVSGGTYDNSGGTQTGYPPPYGFTDSTDVTGTLDTGSGDTGDGMAFPSPQPIDWGGGVSSKLKSIYDAVNGGPGSAKSGGTGNVPAAGMMALGKALESLFSKPLFQPRQSLIGNPAAFKGQLDSFGAGLQQKQANNPANSTPDSQEVRKWLSMAMGK